MPILSAAKSRLHLTFVLVLTLFLFSVSCSHNQSPSSSSKEAETKSADTSKTAPAVESSLPDPCMLLTKAEAESILGAPIKDPQPNSLGGNKICDYNTTKLYGGIAPYSIHIAIIPETRKVWDAGKKLHADAKESRPVADLGDDAYFLLDELDVLSNERSITIG